MARGNRQDLYLSVNGDVRGLQNTVKVGRTVLNEFGTTAGNVLEEVERQFQKIGAGGPPAGLKEAERAYTETFRRIGASAREAAKVPTGQAAIQILDANASRAAAEAATNKAAALRIVAEAASRADQATNGNSAATRAYAVAAATAAVEADKEAAALREQAGIIGTVEQQLVGLTGAQQRSRVMSGQARAGYQQLSYQLGDISMQYSLGTSASIIFAQQSGQVIQALQMIGGEGNKVLSVLGGPWGIALSSALVVATPFVAKLFEGAEGAEKQAEKLREDARETAKATAAKELFAKTLDGVEVSLRHNEKALNDQAKAYRSVAENAELAARAQIANAQAERDRISRELSSAMSRRDGLTTGANATDPRLAQARREAIAQVTNLQGQLQRTDAAIQQSESQLYRSQLDQVVNVAGMSKEEQLDRGYDRLVRKVRERAEAEKKSAEWLSAQVERINAAREAEKARVRESERKPSVSSNRQFGREIDVAGATAIIEGIGGRVTSGLRSRDKQEQLYAAKLAGRHNGPVAKPGTSLHETGNAIDVAFGPGISVASIKKAFAEEGVALRKILREPGQKVYHVEFGKAGPSAATTARREQAAADRQTRDADAYASLLSQAKEAQYRIERSRVGTIEQSANLDVQAVERQRADLDRAAQKGVELKRWTQAEADALKLIYQQNASSEVTAIRERERSATVARRAEIEQSALEDQASLLRLQGDLAGTAADRRAIARQLLKIEQDQVEVALRAQIANEQDPDRRAALQRRLRQVPREYALRGEALDRQNADPLQAYGRQLLDATADMDEALKGVAANGFAALEDASARASASAITDLLKIGGVAGDVINGVVQDLIRLAIQKAIVSAIGSSFLGLKDGGLVGEPVLKRAGGGPIFGAGGPRDDAIPAMLSNGEYVINAASTRRYRPVIEAINANRLPGFADGGPVSLPSFPSIAAAQRALQAPATTRPLVFDLRGAVLTADLLLQMQQLAAETSGAVIREAAPAIVDAAASNTMNRLGRASI